MNQDHVKMILLKAKEKATESMQFKINSDDKKNGASFISFEDFEEDEMDPKEKKLWAEEVIDDQSPGSKKENESTDMSKSTEEIKEVSALDELEKDLGMSPEKRLVGSLRQTSDREDMDPESVLLQMDEKEPKRKIAKMNDTWEESL